MHNSRSVLRLPAYIRVERGSRKVVLPATSDYSIVAVLILGVTAVAVAILLLTHLIGPRRVGAVKHSTYESGVDLVGDARKRFNVRFYLVAVLFLVFDVEIIFLYPWAVLFPRLRAEEGAQYHDWAADLSQGGFTPTFFAVGIGIFFVLLTIGFIYEWRRGVFRWD